MGKMKHLHYIWIRFRQQRATSPLVEVHPLLSAFLVRDWHFYFKASQFPSNSNVLLQMKRHYSPPYSFQQA